MIDTSPKHRTVLYTTKDAPTLRRFHNRHNFVRGVMGPIGSGKSTACCMEILVRAMEQAPSLKDGKRHTRWAIIRNSYPELKTTTMKTWGDWCPPEYGKLTMSSPIRHFIETNDLVLEVLFLALDRAEDQKKLLSLELTGAWVNEAREIPKPIIDTLTGRVGRYPAEKDGGCTWSGIFMDTNPPDDQSWWYRLAEEETPEGWEFFRQPSGRGAHAENLPNLPKGYYKRVSAGKDPDWIKAYVDGDYAFVIEGKPVFPSFRDRTHTAKEVLKPIEGIPLLVGVDFGLTPAAVIGQKLTNGRWVILDEYVTEDTGVRRFAENFSRYIQTKYEGFDFGGGWGDPSGNKREYREETAFSLMNEFCPLSKNHTVKWREAPSNDTLLRFEAVHNVLDRMIDGDPGILISPEARYVRKGFAGGYHYKLLRSGDGTQTQEFPNKNKFSHPMDALQYLLTGGGEYNVVLRKVDRSRDLYKLPNDRVRMAADLDYDIFG